MAKHTHAQSCLELLIIGEMRIKTTVKYHTLEWLKFRSIYRKGCGTTRTCIASRNVKYMFTIGNSLAVFSKVRIRLPYNPTIVLLHIYPKEMKENS